VAYPRLRFLSVLIASAAAAWGAWWLVPSSAVDRQWVRVMASTTANPPFIIDGEGTQASPWSLRVLAPYRKADPKHEPSVVSLGDDPEGIFQTSPPSPVDLAVVMKNMHRLGAERPAISTLLAWQDPEAISISALDNALGVFPAVSTATPLSRGATGTPIPATFRRASIDTAQVQGDLTNIPIVNRMPLPGVILGGDNAFSGFTLVEHDPDGAPMLARWDDRIVLSFALVSVLVERNLPFDGVKVELGNFIKIGPRGPYIPIDKTGRISTAPGKTTDSRLFPAVALGDIREGTPLAGNGLVLLRDDQSNAEAPTRAFSKRITPLVTDLSSGAGMSEEQILTRPETWRELVILGIVSVLLALPSHRRKFSRGVLYGVIGACALGVHLIGFLATSMWPPTLPILCAVAGAFFVSHLFFRDGAVATTTAAPTPPPSAPEPEEEKVPAVPEPVPPLATLDVIEASIPAEVVIEPVIAQPATEAPMAPPAKKAAAKKAAAKKTAARKTAAKKVTSAPEAETGDEPKKTPAKKTAAKKTAAKKAPAKKAAAKKAPRGKKADAEDPPSDSPS